MRIKRIFWFLVTIVLGVVIGLVYGWIINPMAYANASPKTMRSDYQTDYVLMTAEIYQADANMQEAARRLSALGSPSLEKTAQDALTTARALEYSPVDIATMTRLLEALQENSTPPASGNSP